MKKLLIALIGLTLAFSSCSSSDESLATNDKLPVSRTYTYTDKSSGDVDVEKEEYTYDSQNRLVTTTETYNGDKAKNEFLYENNKLVRVNHYESNDVTISSYTEFVYNANRIVKTLDYTIKNGAPENDYSNEYTYDNSGRVSKIVSKELFRNQWTTFMTQIEYINETKIKVLDENGAYQIIEYENTDKYVPFSQVTGLGAVLKIDYNSYMGDRIVKEQEYFNSQGSPSNSYSKDNTFDNENFLSEVKSESDYSIETTTFKYNK